jgi:hypothetical protein
MGDALTHSVAAHPRQLPFIGRVQGEKGERTIHPTFLPLTPVFVQQLVSRKIPFEG